MRFASAFAMIFLTTLAVSAGPANDNLANAQALTGNSGVVNGSNVGATKEANEPNHGLNAGGASVWFKFTAQTDGVLRLSTDGSVIDTLLGVYLNSPGNGLVSIAQNDNWVGFSASSISSLASIGVKAGNTYYIAIDGKNYYDEYGVQMAPYLLQFNFLNNDLNDSYTTPVNLYEGGGYHSITSSNVGATKQAGEQNHMGNIGGKSVWFRYRNTTDYARRIYLRLSGTGGLTNAQTLKAVLAVYTGDSPGNFAPVFDPAGLPYITDERFTFLAQPHTDYYIAADGYNAGQGAESGTFTLTYGVSKDARFADFDKDGRADLAVFRPSDGTWYSQDSGSRMMRAMHWGMNGDVPVVHKDDDDNVYYTVYRPSTGDWYKTLSGPDPYLIDFGLSTDVPLAITTNSSAGRDWTYPVIFRPQTGDWWFVTEEGGYPVHFGEPGDIPLTADFDGDGNDELTVFRPSNGTWHMLNRRTNQYQTIQFGLSGDKPVVSDYDGDGRADIAVFRPSNGTWYVLTSIDGSVRVTQFGTAGDIPQAADFDNDSKADLAVFRTGTWWVLPSLSGEARVFAWGLPGDIPLTAPMK